MEFSKNDMTMSRWSEIRGSCTRTSLLTTNGFCMLVALFTLTIAIMDTRVLKLFSKEQTVGTFASDLMIMVACLLLVGVCAFGSVGLMKENERVLRMYAGFLSIMVLLEVLVAVYVALQRYSLELSVVDWLRDDFFQNMTGYQCAQGERWNNLQTTYECCGLNGPGDYQVAQKQISLSCCPGAYRPNFNQQRFYKDCIKSSRYYRAGCGDEIMYVLRSNADVLILVAFLSWGLEAAGILLAMRYASHLNDEDSELLYRKTFVISF